MFTRGMTMARQKRGRKCPATKAGPKSYQGKATTDTWITKKEETLEQQKRRRNQERKSRNQDELTTNHAAFGDERGRLASNPLGQRTYVRIKPKRYKPFSSK